MGESFGATLRRHRVAASLTQEALAERAALSATAIAALERGRRRAPRLSTLRQLARALDLDEAELAALARAASAEADGGDTDDGDGDVDDPMPTGAALRAPTSDHDDDGARSVLPLPPAVARRWRTTFVGRGPEYERLRAGWDEDRRLVSVVGEPGIGKTRLVSQLARSVHDEGGSVAWGSCSEERLGSYLPFVEILRQIVLGSDPVRLAQVVGRHGELTRLVPELTDRVGPLPAPSRAEAGTEQRLLFDAVASLLAAQAPVLVVIDDLHWADEATLALLGYLVRDPRSSGVVIVCTARDIELHADHAGLVADLGRHTDTERIRLTGLRGDDLSALLADLAGAPAGSDLVASVEEATEGNPFFAEEMTVHLIDAGLVQDAGGGAGLLGNARAAGVPERVRETLGRRLASLPDATLELLVAGAVIGREFDLSVAAAASSISGPELVDAADDGLLSGLVVETGPGRMAFSHALVQDAVGARSSHARRAETHRRVAEAIEARWADDPAVAADLARHWEAVAAVDPTVAPRAAAWETRAGDVALAAAAADEAISRYEQASALWAASTREHADALVRLGTALQYRGRADEADDRFRAALHLAVALGDNELQARAAIGMGRRYPYWETDPERVAALDAALAALTTDESVLRPTLMAMLVAHLVLGLRPDEARRRDELAAQVRAVVAAPGTGPEVLLSLGQSRIYNSIDDPDTLDRVAARLAGVAEGARDLRVLAGARFAQIVAALDRADMPKVQRATARYGAVAERLDDPREHAQVAIVRSTIAFIEGRYEEAREESDDALELGAGAGDFNAGLLHFAQGLLRAVDQGQAADVLPLLLEATDYNSIAAFVAGTALCAALAGDGARTLETLDTFVAGGLQGLPQGADWLAPVGLLAHGCVVVGATEHAGALYDALAPHRGGVIRIGPMIGWWGPVDHHCGALCRLAGRHEEARVHLEQALAVETRMGARAFEARTRAELARVEAAVGDGSSVTRSEELLGQARAGARQIGAAGIVAEIDAAGQ